MNPSFLPGFSFSSDGELTKLFDGGYNAAKKRIGIDHNPYESKSWTCGWLTSRVEFLEKFIRENCGEELYKEYCSVE